MFISVVVFTDIQLYADNEVICGLSLSTSHKVVIGSMPLRIIPYLIIMKSNLHKDMDHNYIQMLINVHRMKPNPKVYL